MQDLIELEEQGWQALTLVGEASKKFYRGASQFCNKYKYLSS